MTDTNTCARCRRPLADARLCDPCLELLERAVASLEVLLPELHTTVARLDVVSLGMVHSHSRVDEAADVEERATPAWLRTRDGRVALVGHAAPVNLDAADLLADVQGVLAGWVRHLAGVHQLTDRPVTPRPLCGPLCRSRAECGHDSCAAIRKPPAANWEPSACRWLWRHLPDIRLDEEAGRIHTELTRAARRVEKAVDNRDPDMYLGPCDAPDITTPDGQTITVGICGTDMYAHLGDPTVTCHACGAEYDVAERRDWLLEAVRDVWARPGLIASALSTLEMPLTAAVLNNWISRDRRRHERCPLGGECGCILQVGIDSDELSADGRPLGKPLYRVGAVIDRVQRAAGRIAS